MPKLKDAQNKEKTTIGGHALILSNLDKVYWPAEGYTKGDLIQYYRDIAPTILPYLKNRPMVLRRNPQGIEGQSFFQKDTSDLHLAPWMKTIKIQHETSLVQYLIIQNEAALVYIANLGCIELNPFISQVKNLEFPDYLIWDLDPEAISFDHVVETAQVIHEILEQIHITSYCKTSGGRGLHVCVPLGAKYTYDQIKLFAQLVANVANQRLPKITSLERMPAKRQGKVYIDTLQNEYSKTIVAPYCLRPKPHAPASTPLKWSEVKSGLNPVNFNILTLPNRLKKMGDIFTPILEKGIDLQKCLKYLEKLS